VTQVLLRAEGLVKSYKRRRVVDGVSFHVRPGEVVGLLGPNGAGKTTCFNMVIGLVTPDGGSVRLGEEELGFLPMHKRARRGLGYLPQEASIFRKLSVRQNFTAVLEALGVSREEREARALALLQEFRLEEVAESAGETLSGGERRRAEVARSLLSSPRFILFDEPFAGIDPIAIIELKKMLRYLKEKGLGILVTDHNVRDTLSITDRAYIISNGGILDEGAPEKLIANPKVKETYLGKEFRL